MTRFNEGRGIFPAKRPRPGDAHEQFLASMKGGEYSPPNCADESHAFAAAAASMKGGEYSPPNFASGAELDQRLDASMKGGEYSPPNLPQG